MGLLSTWYEKAKTFVKKAVEAVSKFFSKSDTVNEHTGDYYGEQTKYRQTDDDSVNKNAEAATRHAKEIEPHADRLEKEYFKVFEKYFAELTGKLTRDKQDLFSTMFKNNVSSLKGTIKTYMTGRYSTSDHDFLRVLEMDKGKEKKNAMKRFQDKVQKEAVALFCEQLQRGWKSNMRIPKHISRGSSHLKMRFTKRLTLNTVRLQTDLGIRSIWIKKPISEDSP